MTGGLDQRSHLLAALQNRRTEAERSDRLVPNASPELRRKLSEPGNRGR
jgi:hypothetical protein